MIVGTNPPIRRSAEGTPVVFSAVDIVVVVVRVSQAL